MRRETALKEMRKRRRLTAQILASNNYEIFSRGLNSISVLCMIPTEMLSALIEKRHFAFA